MSDSAATKSQQKDDKSASDPPSVINRNEDAPECQAKAVDTKQSRSDTKSPRQRQTASSCDGPVSKRPRRRKTQTEQQTFPSILMGILSNPEYVDTIAFLSDERRFIIVNPMELETRVLPLYAAELGGTVTYDMFVLMLCNWGFQIKFDDKYPDIKVYSHRFFKKGDWESCLKIDLVVNMLPPETYRPTETTLLQRMDASRATRRLSGVGLDGNHVAMRSFLQNQMVRRMSLPLSVPQFLQQYQLIKKNVIKECSDGIETKDNQPDDTSAKVASEENTMDEEKIVSEAVAALSNQMPSKPLRRHSIEEINSMTQQLLQRSIEKKMGKPPFFGSVYGNNMANNNVIAEVGAKVDAKARLLYAKRRASLTSCPDAPVIDSADKNKTDPKVPSSKSGKKKNK